MITVNPNKLKEIENEKAKKARAIAFTSEYDPLVGKFLRGEATQEELLEKANEIRARFPYQE